MGENTANSCYTGPPGYKALKRRAHDQPTPVFQIPAGHRKRVLASLGDDSSLSYDGLGYLLKAEGRSGLRPSLDPKAQTALPLSNLVKNGPIKNKYYGRRGERKEVESFPMHSTAVPPTDQ